MSSNLDPEKGMRGPETTAGLRAQNTHNREGELALPLQTGELSNLDHNLAANCGPHAGRCATEPAIMSPKGTQEQLGVAQPNANPGHRVITIADLDESIGDSIGEAADKDEARTTRAGSTVGVHDTYRTNKNPNVPEWLITAWKVTKVGGQVILGLLSLVVAPVLLALSNIAVPTYKAGCAIFKGVAIWYILVLTSLIFWLFAVDSTSFAKNVINYNRVGMKGECTTALGLFAMTRVDTAHLEDGAVITLSRGPIRYSKLLNGWDTSEDPALKKKTAIQAINDMDNANEILARMEDKVDFYEKVKDERELVKRTKLFRDISWVGFLEGRDLAHHKLLHGPSVYDMEHPALDRMHDLGTYVDKYGHIPVILLLGALLARSPSEYDKEIGPGIVAFMDIVVFCLSMASLVIQFRVVCKLSSGLKKVCKLHNVLGETCSSGFGLFLYQIHVYFIGIATLFYVSYAFERWMKRDSAIRTTATTATTATT